MNRIRRGHKVLALAAAATLVVAACGSDDDSGSDDTTVDTEATTDTEAPGDTEAPTDTEATTDTEAPTGTDGEEPAGEAAFRITYELSDTAVWNDGTDITVADFQCGLDAVLGTPGSLSTTGYDAITSISEGETPKQIVVEMNRVYAPYKTLFDSELLKADEFEDCNDVSTDFAEGITFSGREWLLESWTPEQLVYVPNPGYTGEKVPQAERMVIVPAEDGTTLLKSGAVDFIFPQAYTGIDAELDDPNVEYDSALGGSYEALYFMQVDDDRAGPFSDDDLPRSVREVDRPGRSVQPDLRAVRSGHTAADLWADRPGPVLRPGGLHRHVRPGSGGDAPDRRRLDEERRRYVGQPRRGSSAGSLDGQHRQHPS